MKSESAARAAATLWLAAVAAAGSAAPDAVARTLSSRRATDAAIGGHFAVNGDRHVPSHAIYSWRDGSWRCWDAP